MTTRSSQSSNASGAAYGGPISRKEILARAKNWVDKGVIYGAPGAPDSAGHRYRTDCSGYVAMAWRLPSPAPDTKRFINTGSSPWYALDSMDDLLPGDAMVRHNGDTGHIELFSHWVDPSDHRKGAMVYSLNETGKPARLDKNLDPEMHDYMKAIRYRQIVDSQRDATTFLAIKDDGAMLFYRLAGADGNSPQWAVTAKTIGTGWNFKHIVAGENGSVCAIKDDGEMLFYRLAGTDSDSPRWAVTAKTIGTGWNFKHIVAGGNGVVLAVRDDGEMLFYRLAGTDGDSPRWVVAAKTIGTGWNFKHIVAGGNGVVLAIKDDGEMLFYRLAGTDGDSPRWVVAAKTIGTGWNFKHIVAGASGSVCAIKDNGEMLFYRLAGTDSDSPYWALTAKTIGTGWHHFGKVLAS